MILTLVEDYTLFEEDRALKQNFRLAFNRL